MSGKVKISPVAGAIPISPIVGVTAVEVQAALEEIYNLAKNASRGAIGCGFDGSASTGRWLEFFANNPSDNSPFVVPEPSILRAISASSTSNATCVITVFKNGVSVATLTFTAAQVARNKTLSVSLTDLDEISIQVTSGSISRPTFFMFIQTL